MERESFQNHEIAEILNKNFVSIKVDREERPDIDEVYMSAVMALSGRGGWPLTVFLTPNLKPFFGGTYFPPEDTPGMPGFKRLITRISEIWKQPNEREKIIIDSERLSREIKKRSSSVVPGHGHQILDKELLNNSVFELKKSFDQQRGGFGNAPKFPPCQAIFFLLQDYYHNNRHESLEMVTSTLEHMYSGGISDHLAGGFHRYSTDSKWLVPHFEKMLYDNAQLASVYTLAYLVTGKNLYSNTAKKTFDYVMTYMTDGSGGFYSAEDADVEGKEGLFYLWKQGEIYQILNEQEADIFSHYYNIKKEGNFPYQESYHKGMNILHITGDLSLLSQKYRIKEDRLQDILDTARSKLLKSRDKRTRPFLDDKIITSWNSLMISSFSLGYQVFEENLYLSHAQNAADFIIHNLQDKDKRLFRVYRSGKRKYYAYLEDYAFFIRALIDLYESDFNEKWIFHAESLTQDMIKYFWDDKKRHFFNTTSSHENPIVKTISLNDSAVPSPSGVSVEVLIRMGRLFQKNDYMKKAKQILQSIKNHMSDHPRAYMKMLLNVGRLVYPDKEVAIIGKKNSEQTKRMIRTLRKHFIPNLILAFLDPEDKHAQKIHSKIPFLKNKNLINGKPTVYVCQDYTCKTPVTSSEHLAEQL